jgi:hypothetical protein
MKADAIKVDFSFPFSSPSEVTIIDYNITD